MSQNIQHSDYVTMYVTAESEDVAVHIATALVREKLIACANVNPGIRSIYEWDGTIQLEKEVMIVMKTLRVRIESAIARIKELHSFEVPCITVMPIIDGNPDYMAWMEQQVGA